MARNDICTYSRQLAIMVSRQEKIVSNYVDILETAGVDTTRLSKLVEEIKEVRAKAVHVANQLEIEFVSIDDIPDDILDEEG